jgi:short-subunit dehydrogenase
MTPVSLLGATALITGASRGLGAFLAMGLAKKGVNLVPPARDTTKLEQLAGECRRAGVRVRVIAADVAVPADRARLVREAEAGGAIDMLVNNAGIEIAVGVADQSEHEVEAQIATNLIAPIELSRLFLPAMKVRKRGVIVNVSSMSGKSPTPYNAVYAATKFGLNGFTSSLRIEIEADGLHAGVVCPSFMAQTGMWSNTGLKAPALLREVPPEKFVDGVLAVIAGAPEVLVTSGPVRPLLALRELVPGIDAFVLRKTGVLQALEARAAVVLKESGRR